MRVRDLKKELARMPDDALVVINDKIVQAVTTEVGRVSSHPMESDIWRRTPNGREKALIFLVYTEQSDGEIGLSDIHT